MKERPLILGAPMVRATLDDRKSQTRRIIVPQFGQVFGSGESNRHGFELTHPGQKWKEAFGVQVDILDEDHHWRTVWCPYGKVGDRLWVREAWRVDQSLDTLNGTQIIEGFLERDYRTSWIGVQYEADGARIGYWPADARVGRYRAARFMPRWASRLTLEITEIRVERLQSISYDNCIAEGIEQVPQVGMLRACGWRNYCADGHDFFGVLGAEASFCSLWQSIHGAKGADSWGANPWVWAISFRKIEL